MIRPIKPKERETIIQSLKSGVVPRMGLQHIHVGRNEELKSFVKDIDTIAEGGTAFRFVIGEYGSGKTFLLSLVRTIALEKGLVTVHADLSPNKRLHGSGGRARLLFSELISNISTRTKPDGNALSNILDKFITQVKSENLFTLKSDFGKIIMSALSELYEYSSGFSFATVVMKYWMGYETGDDILKNNALRWLRAEYTSRADAYRELGVRDIISDISFYDSLKLYSILIRKAGYKGFLVCLDEMVNLYKITNGSSRKANYEQILYMLNNTLQGSLPSIGFIMCGTPEFLTDPVRGLYSYDALRTRLSENSFVKQLGLIDYNSIVLRLGSLTREELFILLKNLRNVFALGDTNRYLVPDEALESYLHHCEMKIGDSYFRTPRTTIKGFLDLLSTIEQYPEVQWTDFIEQIEIEKDVEPTEISEMMNSSESYIDNRTNDEFAHFKM